MLQNPPLRCCLLSGGSSRRMGQDKALLAHPEGGTWLERSLKLLAQLQAPITLFSCHQAHLEMGSTMELVTAIPEDPPGRAPVSSTSVDADPPGANVAAVPRRHALPNLRGDQQLARES
ncbi:NTP transferase domain-containing protein [Synechococcus lacustris Tous-12m]